MNTEGLANCLILADSHNTDIQENHSDTREFLQQTNTPEPTPESHSNETLDQALFSHQLLLMSLNALIQIPQTAILTSRWSYLIRKTYYKLSLKQKEKRKLKSK